MSVSLVCGGLRNQAVQILFRRLNVTFANGFARHGKSVLDFLEETPRVRALVRDLVLRTSREPRGKAEREYARFRQLLPMMERLSSIR